MSGFFGLQNYCIFFTLPKLPAIFLTLTLFKFGVRFTNDVNPSFSSYDFAVGRSFFNRCSYFHCSMFYLYLKEIRPFDRS